MPAQLGARPSQSWVTDDANSKLRWWRLPSARPLPSAATKTRCHA